MTSVGAAVAVNAAFQTAVCVTVSVCCRQSAGSRRPQSFSSDLLTTDRLYYSPDRQQDRNNPRKSFLQASHAPHCCLQCCVCVFLCARMCVQKASKQERKKRMNVKEDPPKAFFFLCLSASALVRPCLACYYPGALSVCSCLLTSGLQIRAE